MKRALSRIFVPRLAWFGVTALMGGGCDLQTKAWAEEALASLPGRSMMVASPWLEFSLAYNRGTAFSAVPDLGAGARLILGVVAAVVVVALAVMVVRWRSGRGEAVALGAIAGGAIGNGLDRALRVAPGGGTGVVDFVKVNFPWGGSWPIFNVADVLVAVGAGVLLLGRLRSAPASADAGDAGAAG